MTLSNEVECDEAYVVAGHKGHPEVVKSKGRKGRRRRRKGKAGRGTLAKEKPPVFGMRLLLDSRVVDLPMASNPTFIVLSFLKPLFFNEPVKG